MPKRALTLYQADYPEQARRLCLLGVTDRDLARCFEVSESTINRWKRKHPEFSEALRRGKALADADVAEALYRKALDGELRAIIFWLGNRWSDLWRDKPGASPGRPDHAEPGDSEAVSVRELAKAVAVVLKRGVDDVERN